MKWNLIFLFLSCFFVLIGISNGFSVGINTDSLEVVVKDLKGKEKIKTLSDLCYYLSYSDVDKSEKYGQQGLNLAIEDGDSTLIANAYNDLSILYTLKSDYKKGLEYNFKAYEIRKNLKNPAQLISSLSKIGVCYSELGEFEKATKYLLDAIKIVEANGLEKNFFQVYDNLGGIFKEMNQYQTALEYHEKAYHYAIEANRPRAIYTILVNMAGAYRNLGNVKKSIELHLEAEELVKNTKDLRSKALIYSNLGSLYSIEKEFDKVIYYSKKSVEMYEQLDNKDGLSLAHNNIALFYMENRLLNASNRKEVQKELELANKYAVECQSMQRQLQNMEAYAQFYLVLEDYENAMNYKLKADSIDNVLFTFQNNKVVEELKAQYESEKKEKELLQKESSIRQKNYQLIIVIGLTIFIIIGAVENYRKFRFKRKKLLEEAKLKDELAEIKIKNQVQEERLRISRDLHDNIGSQLTFIISSLDMAKYTAKKKSMEDVQEKLSEIKSFSAATIDEFRDTIWALNKENIGLEDLKLKLTTFINKAKEMVPGVHFEINFAAKQELSLDSEKGIKVFRIIQESINNAIKHSQAENIIISMKDDGSKVLLEVKDDGVGMDISLLERKNGLVHMEARAKEIGADFKLLTNLEEGTVVKIWCQSEQI